MVWRVGASLQTNTAVPVMAGTVLCSWCMTAAHMRGDRPKTGCKCVADHQSLIAETPHTTALLTVLSNSHHALHVGSATHLAQLLSGLTLTCQPPHLISCRQPPSQDCNCTYKGWRLQPNPMRT
jgi:hypothetical protein